MTRRWTSNYQHLPGAGVTVEGLVREWFEQTLIEVVLCARTSRWRPDQISDLLAPAALTAAVMPLPSRPADPKATCGAAGPGDRTSNRCRRLEAARAARGSPRPRTRWTLSGWRGPRSHR
jgi:hypothetical protein